VTIVNHKQQNKCKTKEKQKRIPKISVMNKRLTRSPNELDYFSLHKKMGVGNSFRSTLGQTLKTNEEEEWVKFGARKKKCHSQVIHLFFLLVFYGRYEAGAAKLLEA
jgi:hypothetical protein